MGSRAFAGLEGKRGAERKLGGDLQSGYVWLRELTSGFFNLAVGVMLFRGIPIRKCFWIQRLDSCAVGRVAVKAVKPTGARW